MRDVFTWHQTCFLCSIIVHIVLNPEPVVIVRCTRRALLEARWFDCVSTPSVFGGQIDGIMQKVHKKRWRNVTAGPPPDMNKCLKEGQKLGVEIPQSGGKGKGDKDAGCGCCVIA